MVVNMAILKGETGHNSHVMKVRTRPLTYTKSTLAKDESAFVGVIIKCPSWRCRLHQPWTYIHPWLQPNVGWFAREELYLALREGLRNWPKST